MFSASSLYKFATNEYQTPVEKRRLWGDRLSFGTRTYFVSQIAKIFLRASRDSEGGRYNAPLFTRVSHEIMSLVEGCGGRFHVNGLDHVRSLEKPTIFACNHMSALENFVLPGMILPFREVSFVIKASLLNYPIFGDFLRAAAPIPLERSNPREDLQKVMADGVERLTNGCSLIIFPQSTRMKDCPPDSFNSLAAKLARKAKVDIVPIAVKTDFWGNGRWVRDFGPLKRDIPIHMAFGKPIEVSGNGRSAHQEAVSYITSTFARWQRQDG